MSNDTFELYDLKVIVRKGKKRMVCNHKIGDFFRLQGENLSIPAGKTFSIYAVAALLPLLPVKQRDTHKNDWITTDARVACPDPHCGGIFEIIRTKRTTFRHSQVTVVPIQKKGKKI